eukprot:4433852-Prymnesium_polylepis.1
MPPAVGGCGRLWAAVRGSHALPAATTTVWWAPHAMLLAPLPSNLEIGRGCGSGERPPCPSCPSPPAPHESTSATPPSHTASTCARPAARHATLLP